MAELYKYVCPSCGANISPNSDDKIITCSFCGSVFDRTAVLNSFDRMSAEKLAETVTRYKADLTTYNSLETKTLKLADEVTELTNTPTQMPLWTALIIPVQLVGCILLLIMMYVAYKADSKPIMFLTGLLFAAFMVALTTANVKKKRLRRNADNVRVQLREKLEELNAARAEFEQFRQGFDIDAIPKDYRSDEALDYLIGLFCSYQANRLGDAFRMYDEHLHFKKMEAMQKEQVEIQKRQLEIMDELADYDFDDTYDDDDFRLHDTLTAFRESNALNK